MSKSPVPPKPSPPAGFVDIHTHLDAQIGWDPACRPVCWHGVTTALLGNCGVTFAPCRPSDRELLAGMMETVEDITKQAILTGLPWDWEGYGGYLDALERLRPGINVAGLVGHCAVRFYVVGERAVEELATEDEKRAMAEIVAQSIDAGAVGFSTNRYPPHVLPDGRSIPGTHADASELLEIAKVVGPRHALMQNVLDFSKLEFTTQLLRDLAKTSGSRILFSFGAGPEPESGSCNAAYLEALAAGGLDLTAVTQPRRSGFLFGLQTLLPASGKSWGELRRTALPARLVGLADRGTLMPGMRADVNVLDPERVVECMPELVHDFPGGAPRFLQRSCGYRATLVNGEISVEEGATHAALPEST